MRDLAVAVWLILYVALGWVLRNRRIREEHASAKQMVVEFLISIRSIAIFSTIGLSIHVRPSASDAAAAPGATPTSVNNQRCGDVLAHDAYFYWVHRSYGEVVPTGALAHTSAITTLFTAYS